jgi:hypothetical protein
MPKKLAKPPEKKIKKPPAKKMTKTKAKPLKTVVQPKSPLSRFKAFNPKNIEDVNTKHTVEMTMQIGSDGKGGKRALKLVNNLEAKNPSMKELNAFLKTPEVRKIATKQAKTHNYDCGDFARDLHNLAEKEGIRCGFVIIYYNHGVGHGMNAFETRDEGVIFIDFAMVGRYDADRLAGKETEKEGNDFYEIKGRKHYETSSGRNRNIAEISITW